MRILACSFKQEALLTFKAGREASIAGIEEYHSGGLSRHHCQFEKLMRQD
jgi:hypothetical protein